MKENWTYKKLGDLVDIRTGKLDANAANEGGLYPFFTCSKEPLRINKYSYDCECVLVAGNGELNVKYYNGKFDAYQRTYIIELKKDVDELTTYYMYLFFEKYIEALRQKSIGGIIKYIKLGDLTNAIIPIPSLSEQQSIVRELDTINEVLSKKREQLKELDKLAQSIFYDMFGDPVTNEKGWEVNILKDVVSADCPISYGIVQPGDGVENGIPVVRPVDFQNCFIVRREGLKCTTQEISKAYKRTILNGGELLICVRGTTGILGLASEELKGCNVTRGIVPLKFTNISSRVFVQYVLQSKSLQQIIAEKTYGATLKQINMQDLRLLPIPLPPLPLQQAFAEKIEKIEQMKENLKVSIKETETLLESRMSYWFE